MNRFAVVAPAAKGHLRHRSFVLQHTRNKRICARTSAKCDVRRLRCKANLQHLHLHTRNQALDRSSTVLSKT
jgi:hypothetical protein